MVFNSHLKDILLTGLQLSLINMFLSLNEEPSVTYQFLYQQLQIGFNVKNGEYKAYFKKV